MIARFILSVVLFIGRLIFVCIEMFYLMVRYFSDSSRGLLVYDTV